MYLTHWGLNSSPFTSCLNPDDFHRSAGHEEALARVQFLVENNRRVGFLLGLSGTGKSLLLEVASRELRKTSCFVAKLNVLGIDQAEFTWKLASSLGCPAAVDTAPMILWRDIADRLTSHRFQHIPTVLFLDDVEEAEADVLSAINRLATFDHQQPETLLTVVVACHRRRTQLLGSKLNELCELRIEIEPWDETDTIEFIHDSLTRLGGSPTTFDHAALTRLHQLGEGIPRRIKQLAELCLVAGAADNTSRIDEHLVDAVYEGLTQEAYAVA